LFCRLHEEKAKLNALLFPAFHAALYCNQTLRILR
jgi:hypothetical protein